MANFFFADENLFSVDDILFGSQKNKFHQSEDNVAVQNKISTGEFFYSLTKFFFCQQKIVPAGEFSFGSQKKNFARRKKMVSSFGLQLFRAAV